MAQEKRGKGRPSKYNLDLAKKICDVVSRTPYGLDKICKENDDFPCFDTVQQWRMEYEDFSSLYARAKLKQADVLAEHCLQISDESTKESWGADRLRIDTRKWLASKLLPRLYGDRLVLEKKEDENEELREQIRALRAELDEKNKKDY